MKFYFDCAAAVFAIFAALFWFASASGKIPPIIPYWDQIPATDPFYMAVIFSAKMNRVAAVFSGLSALSMAAGLLIRSH